jgi:hypothetical protein
MVATVCHGKIENCPRNTWNVREFHLKKDVGTLYNVKV